MSVEMHDGRLRQALGTRTATGVTFYFAVVSDTRREILRWIGVHESIPSTVRFGRDCRRLLSSFDPDQLYTETDNGAEALAEASAWDRARVEFTGTWHAREGCRLARQVSARYADRSAG